MFHQKVGENQKTIESREFSQRDMRSGCSGRQFSEASLPQQQAVPGSYPLDTQPGSERPAQTPVVSNRPFSESVGTPRHVLGTRHAAPAHLNLADLNSIHSPDHNHDQHTLERETGLPSGRKMASTKRDDKISYSRTSLEELYAKASMDCFKQQLEQ